MSGPRLLLPGPLTRRRLWWQSFWRYALAHRPLCERFAPHVLRIGGAFVCRSCALLYASAAIAAAVVLPLASREALLVALPALAVPVVGLSVPALYDRFSRSLRDLLRIALGVTLALLLALWLHGEIVAAAIATAALAFAHRAFAVQHRRRSLDACAGCPELDHRGVCSGFAQQIEAQRRFDEAIVARSRAM